MASGCVEVTPPTGTTNASSYGTTGSGGNLSSTTGQPSGSATPGPAGTSPPSGASPNTSQPGPGGEIPTPQIPGIVQVTPRSLEGLSPATTPIYSGLSGRSAIGPEEELVTIYQMNHSFVNDAVAYAYPLENPPLYVEILFSPELGTDIISYGKRTGDKEGQIDITVKRPLKDAWYEIRVYNQRDGSEIVREGYGKTYSQSNKTFALRTAGSYQFDMLGNHMNATVNLKVPRSMADLALLQNVTGMINEQKANEGKIAGVFLVVSDLPTGWTAIGDITRTSTNYQSTFQKDYITLRQKITKYDSTESAIADLEKVKSSTGSGSSPSLVGQTGFQSESTSKSQVVFVQGLYLVELSSFSVPDHVSLTDLQSYGKIIASKINTA